MGRHNAAVPSGGISIPLSFLESCNEVCQTHPVDTGCERNDAIIRVIAFKA